MGAVRKLRGARRLLIAAFVAALSSGAAAGADLRVEAYGVVLDRQGNDVGVSFSGGRRTPLDDMDFLNLAEDIDMLSGGRARAADLLDVYSLPLRGRGESVPHELAMRVAELHEAGHATVYSVLYGRIPGSISVTEDGAVITGWTRFGTLPPSSRSLAVVLAGFVAQRLGAPGYDGGRSTLRSDFEAARRIAAEIAPGHEDEAIKEAMATARRILTDDDALWHRVAAGVAKDGRAESEAVRALFDWRI